MPCALTGSQALDCKDGIGGIAEIKIKALPSDTVISSDYVVTSGTVAIGAGSRSGWYTYSLEKETSSINDDPQPNQQNGTLFFQQTIKLIMNKMSARLSHEVSLLAKNRLQFAIKDMNGVYWLYGMKYGMDMQPSVAGSGVARGDRSGYDLTFLGKEDSYAPTMSAASYAQLVS